MTGSDPVTFALALLLGYLVGTVPSGLLFTRLAGLGDVRRIGSGNIGATNVLRTGRKGIAALTLAADILKGYLPAALALAFWGRQAAWAAALGAVLGHCFPIWLGFRGGRGVATAAGVLLALSPWVLLAAALVFAATVALTRYVSLGSLLAAATAPAAAALSGMWPEAGLFLLLALVVAVRHRANIERLLAGREHRLTFGGRPD